MHTLFITAPAITAPARRCARAAAAIAVVLAILATGIHRAEAVTTRVSAATLLSQLATGAEHSGYDRSYFRHWVDADRNGCDTRSEVLLSESTTTPTSGSGCTVLAGRWVSKYDGVSSSNPSGFDIDHLVPLAEAWQSGADLWNADTRMRYANDLGYSNSLLAVTASSNRSKGDREPQNWMPAQWQCNYVATWVAVKWRWRLAVDTAERSFLAARLASCANPTVTQPGRAIVT